MTALFGGAFDPIHNGHIEIAREVRRRFGCDVTLIPSGNPPHKPMRTAFAHRLAMLHLACAGDGFAVSEIENTVSRTYTFDTLPHFPPPRLFVIGADAFAEIETWYRWRDVIAMTEFAVVSRPGHDYRVPEGAVAHRLDGLALDVSSSAIRAALARGERPAALAPGVYDYIRKHRLYTNGE